MLKKTQKEQEELKARVEERRKTCQTKYGLQTAKDSEWSLFRNMWTLRNWMQLH